MAAKRRTRESVEAALREAIADDRWAYEHLKRLPDGVDPRLVGEVVLAAIDSTPWLMARACRELPVAAIREAVARLPTKRGPWVTFLRELLDASADDQELAARWRSGLDTIDALSFTNSLSWGSKQRRSRIRAASEDARTLAAVQAAVASGDEVPLDLLAVLAFDGSETSVDAVLPHVARARSDGRGAFDELERLQTYVRPESPMAAMLESITAALNERDQASPALELPQVIGIGPQEVFWFSAWMGGTGSARAPYRRVQVHLSVDSRSAGAWYSLSVIAEENASTDSSRSTSFSSRGLGRDELGLGASSPADWPAWLVRSAARLGVSLNAAYFELSTNLRGKRRTRLVEWLLGG